MEATALLEADHVTREFATRSRIRRGAVPVMDNRAQAEAQEQAQAQVGAPGTTTLTKMKTPAANSWLQRDSIAAVDDVSLVVPQEPTLISLVGESGSGKTTLSRMLLGLDRPTKGEIRYRGKNIFTMSKAEWQVYRRDVQAVFQDPYAIYNPFYHVEHVFQMVIKQFKLATSQAQARKLTEESLRAVDLRPGDVLGRYPHQLSGGERQRVMLARIHMLQPRVIIADEPVSMIDAAVRTLFMNILLDFRDQRGISCLFITHNLATAYYLGGKMVVLCYGRVIESGDMDTLIEQPAHPYTRQLLSAVPSGDPERRWSSKVTAEIADRPLTHDGHRCVYATRCPHVMQICNEQRPPDFAIDEGRTTAACYLYRDMPVERQGVESRT
jgi:peptide/nickel transport system ATP-binding protein